MASRKTFVRMRKKLAEKGAENPRDSQQASGETQGATGGRDPEEELSDIAKTMQVLKLQSEKVNLQTTDSDIVEEVAKLAKNLKQFCKHYDFPSDKELSDKKHREWHDSSNSNSSSDSSLDTPKVALKMIEKDLMSGHIHFVDKVFDYLLKYYGLRYPSNQENDEFYDKSAGEAILALCMLYGGKWRENFKTVNKTLFKLDFFVLHCGAIEAVRDCLYFYSYLIRLAVIFEMALYCFENGYDYFDLTKVCAYRFVDFICFRDEGGWPSLKNAASALAVVTRPLRFLMNCPKNNVNSYADVVKELRDFSTKGISSITKREITLLNELKDKFDSHSRNDPSNQEEETLRRRELIDLLMTYFKVCLPKESTMSIEVPEYYMYDFTMYLAFFVDNTEAFHMALKKYRQMKRDIETSSGVFNLKSIDKKIEYIDIGIEYIKRERTAMSPERPTYDPLLHLIGTKRKNIKKHPHQIPRYFPLDRSYVEFVIDLYIQALPSFLRSYSRCYLAPAYYHSCIEPGEIVFLIEESYYKERKDLLLLKDPIKRMIGGIVVNLVNHGYLKGRIETTSPVILPIPLQRLLDSHIRNKTQCERITIFGKLTLVVPKIKEVGTSVIWHVKGPLGKTCTSLSEVVFSINDLERLLSHKSFRACKEEIDEKTLLKFRFRTSCGNKIEVPQKDPALPKISSGQEKAVQSLSSGQTESLSRPTGTKKKRNKNKK